MQFHLLLGCNVSVAEYNLCFCWHQLQFRFFFFFGDSLARRVSNRNPGICCLGAVQQKGVVGNSYLQNLCQNSRVMLKACVPIVTVPPSNSSSFPWSFDSSFISFFLLPVWLMPPASRANQTVRSQSFSKPHCTFSFKYSDNICDANIFAGSSF